MEQSVYLITDEDERCLGKVAGFIDPDYEGSLTEFRELFQSVRFAIAELVFGPGDKVLANFTIELRRD